MRLRLAGVLLTLTLAACGDEHAAQDPADGGPPVDAASVPDAGPSPDAAPEADRRGQVQVLEVTSYWKDGNGHVMAAAYGTISARFLDVAEPRWQHQTMASGACRLFTWEPAFCQQPCSGICVETDVCQPWPHYLNAGTLTVSGLAVPATTLARDPLFNVYTYQLPHPATELFADDATVEIAASGDTLPALSARARGVPTIVPAIVDGLITLDNHVDHTIHWTPAPGSDARVQVTLNANNTMHGGPYLAVIECDAPDSAGAITLPAAMVDAFPGTTFWFQCLGSDCPPSWIRRYHETAMPRAGGGYDSLVVGSELRFYVEHHLQP